MDIERLNSLAISGSGYIFDPATGNSFTANETALFILNHLKEGRKSEEIATLLTETFEVSEDTAEQDTVTVIEMLQSHYLI